MADIDKYIKDVLSHVTIGEHNAVWVRYLRGWKKCREALRQEEWTYVVDRGYFCPACSRPRSAGHSPTCTLDTALSYDGTDDGKES